MRVRILGSGTSTGVPVLGCDCKVCTSSKPHYKRLRSSILISFEGGNALIDTGPDLRQQMLSASAPNVDAVWMTHTHADHLHGLDEIRALSFKRKSPIELWAKQEHLVDIKSRFHYLFQDTGYKGFVPAIETKEVSACFQSLGQKVETVYLPHGHMQTVAYKVGSFAYATDFKKFPPEAIAAWKGRIHTMVASGIRYREHASHSSVYETIQLFKDLEVKRGFIHHLAHDVDADLDASKLPENVQFAFDGLEFDVSKLLE